MTTTPPTGLVEAELARATTAAGVGRWRPVTVNEVPFLPPTTGRWPIHWRVPTPADLEALEAGYRRGLLPAHAPLLHQRMPALVPGSGEAKDAAGRLYEAARRESEAGKATMVGLAAPQIGLRARALLFDPREDPTDPWPAVQELACVINPTVELLGDDRVHEVEGCLSTGRIRGWVNRAARVRLRGYAPTGEPVDEVHTGLAARVVQHETDHLDGILFPQRIADDFDLLWASTHQDDEFRSYVRAKRSGQTPHWNTMFPGDQWEAIRSGLAVFGSLASQPGSDTPVERATGHLGPPASCQGGAS